MFVIEDEWHAETQEGKFASFRDALAELKRRAALPWDEWPNCAPCTNWRRCGRSYEIIEHDTSTAHWSELSRVAVLEVDAAGCRWLIDPDGPNTSHCQP